MSKKPLKNIRIASVVGNNCVADSRVIKQAEALAEAGASITVFCRYENGLKSEEVINGVCYRRYSPIQKAFSLALMFIGRFFKDLFAGNKRCFSHLKNFFYAIILVFIMGGYFIIRTPLKLINKNIIDNIKGNNFFRKLRTNLFQDIRYYMFEQMFCKPIVNYNPDIIHAHDFETVPLAISCKEKTKAKVIFDAHEIEADREGRNTIKAIKKIETVIRYYFLKIDGFIAVNKSAVNFYLENYGDLNKPIAIIHNSPIFNFKNKISGNIKDVRTQIGLKNGEKLLVYTGAIGQNRGVPEIAEAIKPLDDVHFCIMGPQKEPALSFFKSHVKKLGMVDRVHILPPVPHWEVTQTIKTADCGISFIQPSCLNYYYCLPNKLFESALAGLPMIVTDLPEMKNFVETEQVGLVTPAGDVTALTQTIKKMLANTQKYKPTKEKLDHIQKTYGWPAQAEKLVKLYQEILK